jgi:hypothetical protein
MGKILLTFVAGATLAAVGVGPAAAVVMVGTPEGTMLSNNTEVIEDFTTAGPYDFNFTVPANDTAHLEFAFGAAPSGTTISVNVQYVTTPAGTGYNETEVFSPSSSDSWEATFGQGTPSTWNVFITVAGDPYGGIEFSYSGPLSALGDPDPTATPLPAGLPLFATGLGALGLLGWRARRKSIAA